MRAHAHTGTHTHIHTHTHTLVYQAIEEEENVYHDIVTGHPVVDSWGLLAMTPNCGIPAAGLYIHRYVCGLVGVG
jgi:hypothetical protein